MKTLDVTPRQAELLDLLVEFGDGPIIARKLGVTPDTVRHAIVRLLDKQGHPNRVTLAVAWDRQRRAA